MIFLISILVLFLHSTDSLVTMFFVTLQSSISVQHKSSYLTVYATFPNVVFSQLFSAKFCCQSHITIFPKKIVVCAVKFRVLTRTVVSSVFFFICHRDKLELKAVKDGSASYAALEKKAELYEKLSRGELPDEEDKEKYCVDFFQKSFDHVYEPQMPDSRHGASDAVEPVNDHEDSMLNAKPMGLGRAGTTIDRDEHKRFVRYCSLWTAIVNSYQVVFHKALSVFSHFFALYWFSEDQSKLSSVEQMNN